MDSRIYKTRTGKWAVGIEDANGYLHTTVLTKEQVEELGLNK